MKRKSFTRGEGLLENFLAYRRFCVVDPLIAGEHRDGRILDIGCGTYPYFLLHTRFNEKHGLDPCVSIEDEEQLESKIIFHKIFFEQGTRLPFADQSLSTVTMLGVVEHFRPEQFVDLMKEVRRMLVPDGRFILTTPAPWAAQVLKIMAKFKLISVQEIEGIMAHYSPRSLKKCFAEAGLNIGRMRFGYFQMFLNSWVVIER